MGKSKEDKCPRCLGELLLPLTAISRRDGKTPICSQCGNEEGMIDVGVTPVTDTVAEREARMEKWIQSQKSRLRTQ